MRREGTYRMSGHAKRSDRRHTRPSAILLALALAMQPALAAAEALTPAMMAGQQAADSKLDLTESVTPPDRYPFYTVGDAWAQYIKRGWTSGFLSGSHWLDFQSRRSPGSLAKARARQVSLAPSAGDTTQHDIGFMLLSSYGNDFRLTGDPAAKTLLLTAARSLSTRYDPVVRSVRTRNTAEDFWVYNDTMMNIELLFWGANNGGGAAMRQQASAHALRCATDFLRADGGSYHYVVYDERTGRVLDKGQGQGYSKESTWSRGQAWIIYGMSVAYRETGDARFLAAARKATDYWVARVPDDLVPYWDFDAPNIPNAPRDSSAAAAAASAFVELSRLDPDPARRASYLDLATRTLGTLSTDYLAAQANPAALAHGTYAAMIGAADHGTSWGDYYYREALARYRTQVRRISGPDRYAVSRRASETSFESADAVVVANGATFADALAASSLAGALHAPVLLTGSTSLDPGVASEIRRLGATKAVIIGGPRSVGPAVESALRAVPGVAVERIAGADRYEVAVKVAEKVASIAGVSDRVWVVRGDTFSDALSVSPLAYHATAPILLTSPRSLPPSLSAYLASRRPADVVIVGGEVSVTPAVASAIARATGRPPQRISGADRYQVSVALAERALASSIASSDSIGVVNGAAFADALSGGAVVGAESGVMLLTRQGNLEPAVADLLGRRATGTTILRVFGGEASVSGRVENQLKDALPEQ